MAGELVAEKISALSKLSEETALVTIDDFEQDQGCSLFGGLKVTIDDLELINSLDELADEGQVLVDLLAKAPAELEIRRSDAEKFI